MPFTCAPENEYLEMNLTKYEHDLFKKNFENLFENQIRTKQIERYSMVMNRNTQYCL